MSVHHNDAKDQQTTADARLHQAIEQRLAHALVGEAYERAAIQKRLDHLETRIVNVETAVDALGDDVRDNTKLTQEIHRNTVEMVELFATAKGGFKVVGWFGTFAKWVAGVLAAVAAVWAGIYAIAQNVRGGH